MIHHQASQKCSLFANQRILVVFSVFYLISVILFFSAFGVGINPIEAAAILTKGSTKAPNEPTEPIYYEPNESKPSASPSPPSALKSLGITFGILFWIIGMGAPAVGVLSYLAIWIGLNEKQFTFIRVCGTYTLVFLTLFWSLACGVQVYLQRASPKKAKEAIVLNIAALVLGIISTIGTVIYLFTSNSLRAAPFVDESIDLEVLIPESEDEA